MMLSKRKRSDSYSNSDTLEEQPTKRQKLNTDGIQSLPDNCLYKILARLPSLSQCAASLASKRFNDAFEAFISRDLVKRFDEYHMPQSVKTVLYPRESLAQLATNNDKYLEKLLRKLTFWTLLKDGEGNCPYDDRVAYKEFIPSKRFRLWKYTSDDTSGAPFRVSFFLFGQAGHYVDLTTDIVSYLLEENYNCDLKMTAKLMDGKFERKKINGLLKGYYNQKIPTTPLFSQVKIESKFKNDVKSGDRVKVKWFHKCYPKLNHKKLTKVLEWLGWKMTTIDFAKQLVEWCSAPYSDTYNRSKQDMDTSDTKASLEAITKLILEDEWLFYDAAIILTLLKAKIGLKNRISHAWRKKDKSKITRALSLIDRSMYTQLDVKCQGIFGGWAYYKFLKGELKLTNTDPSKWIRFKFKLSLCRADYPTNDELDIIAYSISTSQVEAKDLTLKFWDEPWTVSKDNIKLVKDELGLDDFTDEEIFELLTIALDLDQFE